VAETGTGLSLLPHAGSVTDGHSVCSNAWESADWSGLPPGDASKLVAGYPTYFLSRQNTYVVSPEYTYTCSIDTPAADEVVNAYNQAAKNLNTESRCADAFTSTSGYTTQANLFAMTDAAAAYVRGNRDTLLDLLCQIVCDSHCTRNPETNEIEWLPGKDQLCTPLLNIGEMPLTGNTLKAKLVDPDGKYEDACDDLGYDFVFECNQMTGSFKKSGVEDIDGRTAGEQRVQGQTVSVDISYHSCLPRVCGAEQINKALEGLANPGVLLQVQKIVALLLKTMIFAAESHIIQPALIDKVLGSILTSEGPLSASRIGLTRRTLKSLMVSLEGGHPSPACTPSKRRTQWTSSQTPSQTPCLPPQVTLIDLYFSYGRVSYATLEIANHWYGCFSTWTWILIVLLFVGACASCCVCCARRLKRARGQIMNAGLVEAFPVGGFGDDSVSILSSNHLSESALATLDGTLSSTSSSSALQSRVSIAATEFQMHEMGSEPVVFGVALPADTPDWPPADEAAPVVVAAVPEGSLPASESAIAVELVGESAHVLATSTSSPLVSTTSTSTSETTISIHVNSHGLVTTSSSDIPHTAVAGEPAVSNLAWEPSCPPPSRR
jgi:hypothetical protein